MTNQREIFERNHRFFSLKKKRQKEERFFLEVITHISKRETKERNSLLSADYFEEESNKPSKRMKSLYL